MGNSILLLKHTLRTRRKNNMFSFYKKLLLNNKQRLINRLYPGIKISLYAEMPLSSIDKIVELSHAVAEVNKYEAKLEKLTDAELKAKTGEFREIILEQEKTLGPQIKELKDVLATITIPEDRDKIKEKIKVIQNKVFLRCCLRHLLWSGKPVNALSNYGTLMSRLPEELSCMKEGLQRWRRVRAKP